MVAADERDYYTVAQAAKLLQAHPSTVWRWIEAGRLPAYRIGPKNIRIRRGDLETVVQPVRPDITEPAVTVDPAAPAPFLLPPMTEEERQRGLKWLEETSAHLEAQRARRAVSPLAESWEDINKARDERSQHLLNLYD